MRQPDGPSSVLRMFREISMRMFPTIASIVIAVLAAVPAGTVAAQLEARPSVWETLMREPLPEESGAKISVISIPVPPAPPGPRATGGGHTHAGPVFAYVLEGKIENQVEPDPPEVYAPGDFFYEAPEHVHRFLHNLSNTEPAKLLIFEAGNIGHAAPAINLLGQAPLRTTVNQEVSLLRLTLPPGALSPGLANSDPGFGYVLEGKIETPDPADQPEIHSAGDLFVEPAGRAGLTFKNASRSEPAKLLLYQVRERGSP